MCGKIIKLKVGKYDFKVKALNEPSEEAILNCRKVVNEVMRNYLNKKI